MKNGTEFDINAVSTELIWLDRETVSMLRSLDVRWAKDVLDAYQNIEGEKACEGLEKVIAMVNDIENMVRSESVEAIKRNLIDIKLRINFINAYCN